MKKITLAGKEYELPKFDFGVIRKFGKLGFTLSDFADLGNTAMEYMAIAVQIIANCSDVEANQIIDESFNNYEQFEKLQLDLINWMDESSFFGKLQA